MSKTEEQRSGRQKGRLVNSGKLKVESGKLNVHKSDKSDKSDKCISKSSQINILPKQHNVKDLSDLSYLSDFKKKVAFTLSEVLIVIAIIGVISAMTLPNLIKNYQQMVTINRLKSTYSTISQAVKMSEVDNGPVTTWDIPSASSSYAIRKDFVDNYFKKYLKNVKECKKTSVCVGEKYYNLKGEELTFDERPTFILNNGVVVRFYTQKDQDVQISVDINGKQRPNTTGKDVFTIVVNKGVDNMDNVAKNQPTGSVHFFGQGNDPNKLKNHGTYGCNKNAQGSFCGALIMQNGWKIPDGYPW